jgi:hypothetical protein
MVKRRSHRNKSPQPGLPRQQSSWSSCPNTWPLLALKMSRGRVCWRQAAQADGCENVHLSSPTRQYREMELLSPRPSLLEARPAGALWQDHCQEIQDCREDTYGHQDLPAWPSILRVEPRMSYTIEPFLLLMGFSSSSSSSLCFLFYTVSNSVSCESNPVLRSGSLVALI